MGLFGNTKSKEDKKKNKIVQKAQKLARKGQIDKAVDEWKSLLKNKSEDANVYNTIGDLYLKGKQREPALDAYCKACDIYADSGFSLKAIAVNKKILKLDPKNLEALTRMAQLNVERGMVNNAKECYLTIAEHHIRSGAHEKALEAYQKIVDLDPKNLKVKLGLADLYFKENMVQEGSRIYGEVIGALLEQGRYEDAEKFCTKLQGSLSSPEAALRYMVQIHLAQDRIEEAQKCLSALGGGDGDEPELAMLKAELLIRQGQAEEGLSIIQSIDRAVVTEFSRLKMFRFLLKAGNPDQALEVLDELSEKYSASHRLDELVALYEQVLAHDAGHLLARHRLVGLLVKTGRQQDVIHQYKELGRIYAGSGQVEEARNIYEKVLDMTPGDLEVQASLTKLNGGTVQEEPAEFGEVPLDGTAASDAGNGPEEEVLAADEGIESFESTAAEAEEGGAEEAADLSSGQGEEIEVVEETEPEQETLLTDNITEADVYIKYGHVKKALVHLEKNLEVAPKHVLTHERLLQVFAEEGNTREQINTLIILSRLYREKDEHEKSDEALNDVLALDPGNEQAQRLLKEGPTVLSSNALDEAPAATEDLQFEFDHVEGPEESAVPEGPREIELSDSVAPDEDALSELLDEANFYLQQGMTDEARVILEKILSLHPERTDIAEKLQALGAEEEPVPAEDVPQPASQEAGDAVDAEPSSIDASEAPGDAVSAETAKETPSSAMSDEFMSFADELREEIDGSVSGILQEVGKMQAPVGEALDFGSEIRKEVEESIASDGHVFSESDVMDIFSEFREGVQRELGDEDHETHYNLGIAYLEMGLLDEAAEEFAIASQDPKRLMDCLTMIGLCRIQKGEFQKALEALEKGLAVEGRTDAEYIGVRYEIAKASELLGDKERTVEELRRIFELNPDYRDVAGKLKALGMSEDEMSAQAGKGPRGKNKVSYL